MDAGGREEHFSRFHIKSSMKVSTNQQNVIFSEESPSIVNQFVLSSVYFEPFEEENTNFVEYDYIFDRNSREQPQIFFSLPN